jgi:hypothetical protein
MMKGAMNTGSNWSGFGSDCIYCVVIARLDRAIQ